MALGLIHDDNVSDEITELANNVADEIIVANLHEDGDYDGDDDFDNELDDEDDDDDDDDEELDDEELDDDDEDDNDDDDDDDDEYKFNNNTGQLVTPDTDFYDDSAFNELVKKIVHKNSEKEIDEQVNEINFEPIAAAIVSNKKLNMDDFVPKPSKKKDDHKFTLFEASRRLRKSSKKFDIYHIIDEKNLEILS
eukprot:CAMPEP_0201576758 /NCGR_PEP_ID=MMETSP0190_2-20130828/22754_1 /ASSEMBLY_ACC=CAM_ASM_000263 /TAXON_ID=37353 /ORGANISM="Rosalina sp." /LENGTH=193 /DNA_ID=CAMNT_0048008007 /DNA_START=333 /DNA_END=915 /DNA_ORIENTATION=-